MSPDFLKQHGRIGEILDAVRGWERLRHAGAFNEDQCRRMRKVAKEFHLEPVGHGQWMLYPVYYSPPATLGGKLNAAGKPSVRTVLLNPHGAQPVGLSLRIADRGGEAKGYVKNPAVSVGGCRVVFPVEINIDQFLIRDGTREATLYDKNWQALETVSADNAPPTVAHGKQMVEFTCEFHGDCPPDVRIEYRTVGEGEQVSDS